MKYVLLILSSLILISCASRDPAEYQTWKQADERADRPELMNRSR